MYLDPGSAGMAIQAFFAAIAALLVSMSGFRATLARVWSRITRKVRK